MVVYRSDDNARSWKEVRVAKESPGHQAGLTVLKDGRVLVIYRNSIEKVGFTGVDIWVHDPETFERSTLRRSYSVLQ